MLQNTAVMNDRLQLHVKYQVTIAASIITMTLIEYSHLLPAAKFRHPQFFICIHFVKCFWGI